MLPGIFPYYVTGAITASRSGAWNASIVAEAVRLGADKTEAARRAWAPNRASATDRRRLSAHRAGVAQ